MVAIKNCGQIVDVFAGSNNFFNGGLQVEEEEGQVEPSLTALERHLTPFFLIDPSLLSQLFIFKIELWDQFQDPKNLSI